MATTAEIKAAIKAVLDATAEYGSIYTEDRETIEKPQPAAIVMWHDGGSADPGPGRNETVTTNLLVRLLVPRPAMSGEVQMQVTVDLKLERLRRAMRQNPTLDTGAGPIVLSCRAAAWDIAYDDQAKRMVAEVKVSITYEEG